MALDEAIKQGYIESAQALTGSARRLFMARAVKGLGKGGQRQAERELGWNRRTIRTGLHERASGCVCVDAYAARGRKRAEEHRPNMPADIPAMGAGQSQNDPRT